MPIEFCDEEGCELREGSQDNELYIEGLLSFEPSPGTVFFVGYTREMVDEDIFRFRNLTPQADGLFFKLSYLFRL